MFVKHAQKAARFVKFVRMHVVSGESPNVAQLFRIDLLKDINNTFCADVSPQIAIGRNRKTNRVISCTRSQRPKRSIAHISATRRAASPALHYVYGQSIYLYQRTNLYIGHICSPRCSQLRDATQTRPR